MLNVETDYKPPITTFGETFTLQRIIGNLKGSKGYPTIIAIGGIHGNEKAGVVALHNVIKCISSKKIALQGNLFALTGNLQALKDDVRFHDFDLNRIWKEKSFQEVRNNKEKSSEHKELIELYDIIKEIINTNKGPFIFLDLHTTSAETKPFITISDSLNNRKFSKNFPVPIILGIEEYLDGPLLSYVNKFGYTALGFEGGSHYKKESVKNCESFIYMALIASKCIEKKYSKLLPNFDTIRNLGQLKNDFWEISYRYKISNNEDFKMLSNFTNLDKIYTNQLLAYSSGKSIKSPFAGNIFMPLYQDKGDDGFFIVNKIPKFWLLLSRFMRKLNLHLLLRLLPGIKKHKELRNTLIVNPKTASFLATEIFHLFGYRKKVLKDDKWIFSKRDKSIFELN